MLSSSGEDSQMKLLLFRLDPSIKILAEVESLLKWPAKLLTAAKLSREIQMRVVRIKCPMLSKSSLTVTLCHLYPTRLR